MFPSSCHYLAFFFFLSGVSCRNESSSSPSYLLLPRDLAFDSTTRLALQSLRQSPNTSFLYLQSLFPHHSLSQKQPYWNHTDYGTLTLVGNKGGHVLEQINQDRSLVWLSETNILSGVMDGHGTAGHFVAEYVRHDLLRRLWNKTNDIEPWLHEVFLQTDQAIPDELAHHGGCTCSLVYQSGEQIYFANTGDSQSFLAAAYGDNEMHVQIMYETRLDKPGHPDEAQRLQHAGAHVTGATEEDDARVWATDPATGHTSGLAMSRVLGDRHHTAVIADPSIQVIDLKAMKEKVIQDYNLYRTQQCQQVTIHADGSSDPCPLAEKPEAVHFFVVSATDGVMDFLEPLEIAQTMAGYLYGNQGHPYLGMEDLLWRSTHLWQQHGQYRDDMAIAYAKTAQV
ncbi:hypothetical protein FisN_27Lh046 [Fistulifera solaris]|uniref:PPM-type phosphatase domain-containing protein n=1 Tax=Fistulifera solaris TaxID=1519565 RepID=A0A1Z5JIE3_FISSO|nr:hypothetical protein FisN_27Lh046 [Fistulifera solaris]|eukprot:GAX13548.1 hypothetical protein FisN_27Lh046 [Fistulifera solaris]